MSFPTPKSSTNPMDLVQNNADSFKDEFNDLEFTADDFEVDHISDLDNQRTDAMTTAEIWRNLAKEWKLTSSADFKQMKIQVISYCCVNGSSPYMDGDIPINGKKYDVKDLIVIISGFKSTLRKFMRSNSDLAHAILSKNAGLATLCARKKAMDVNYATFAADFMDNNSDLGVGTAAYNEVQRSRNRALRGTTNEFHSSREIDPSKIPKTQSYEDASRGRGFN